MKLVMYSGYDAKNDDLDVDLLRLAGARSPKISFVSADAKGGRDEFDYFCDTFHSMGVSKIHFYCFSSQSSLAFDSDIIYLSGGNTFYLLYELRRRKMLKSLRDYAANDGVLAGVSAGAIVMTPSINTASFPQFDRDENQLNLKSMHALKLTNFEFFPHFNNTKNYCIALLNASMKNPYPILGAPDGSGILIDGRQINFYGDFWLFQNGLKSKLPSLA